MSRKNIILISSLGALVLIIALFAIFSKLIVNKEATSLQESTVDKTVSTTQVQTTNEQTGTTTMEATTAKTPEVIKSENIEVRNNSLETDLKATLYENSLKDTFLKLEYYNEGTGVVKELGVQEIPEIKEIFEKRTDDVGYRIKNLYLNPINSGAYFVVLGGLSQNNRETAIYFYNMKDSAVKKLFDRKGKYTDISFTKSLKYMAFSYTGEATGGKSLLQILNCDTNEFIVNESKNAKAVAIGGKNDTDIAYSFNAWQSGSVAKLKEIVSGGEPKDVLYDVEKDVFLNPDGSVVGSEQSKQESEAVKTLKDFYLYLSKEQYNKAYDILDDKFQLNAFKILGATELSKNDIDVNSFSEFGSIFKTVVLENIVEEKLEGANSTIYFYQSFALGEGEPVRQPLVAGLKKTDKGWKIVSVNDGNEEEKPFKQ